MTLQLTDRSTGELAFDGQRVSRRLPCPVCAHLHREQSWCLVDPMRGLAICPRVESPRKIGEAGWLHALDGSALPTIRASVARPEPPVDKEAMRRRWDEGRKRSSDRSLRDLADRLSLPVESVELVRHGVEDGAWLFAMRGHDGRVCGIKLRLHDGRKLCVKGSRLGLIYPKVYEHEARELWVTEGESDLMAVSGWGLNAVARPGCMACVPLVVGIAKGRDIVLLADRDKAGMDGAAALRHALEGVARTVTTITVPEPYKDARGWSIGGATTEDIRWRLASVRG